MSTHVKFTLATTIDAEFLSLGVSVGLIRLLALVRLTTTSGWTRPYEAIIDTGHPISVIPCFIWSNVQARWLLLNKATLFGISGGGVSGRLAEITLSFADEKCISEPLHVKALLLDEDLVPFLIGFENMLTSLKLTCDYSSEKAYLNF